MFNESDFDNLPEMGAADNVQPNDAEKQRAERIELLRQELRFLNKELNMNAQVQGLIGGSAIGYALGMGALGVGLGALLGYNVAQNKPLSPELKHSIKVAIARKKSELSKLESQEDVQNAMVSGVMSSEQMMNYEYRELPFSGRWEAFIGKPSANFHALIWGKPKQGKSYLAVAFAKYLSNFGSVLYIAAEEGFSATLKKKIADFGLTNSRVEFANFKRPENIIDFVRNNHYDFIVIDSVNFVGMTPEQVEVVKDLAPESGVITVQQATKTGQARGSMEFAHNADIIIEVIEGVAYAMGRFAPPSEMQVFENQQVARPQAPPRQQQQRPETPFMGSESESNGDNTFDLNDWEEHL
jgi:hypothetical protein